MVLILNSNNLTSASNIYLNAGDLIIGNNNALGNATIVFNGGGLGSDWLTGYPTVSNAGGPGLGNVDAGRVITNPLAFTGDAVFPNNVSIGGPNRPNITLTGGGTITLGQRSERSDAYF